MRRRLPPIRQTSQIVLAITGALMLGAPPAQAQSVLRGSLAPAETDPAMPAVLRQVGPPSTIDLGPIPAEEADPATSEYDAPPVAAEPVPAVEPVPSVPTGSPRRIRRVAEADPWTAPGIRAGNMILRPSIDIAAGHDSNSDRAPGGKASAYSLVGGELQVQSDWSRHSFIANLRGAYTSYLDNSEASSPRFSGEAALRLDATRITRVDIGLRAAMDTERFGDPSLPSGARGRPRTKAYGSTVGVTVKPNRLGVTIEAAGDTYLYQDVALTDGTILPAGDRNFSAIEGRIRAGYEISPAFQPFVEASTNERIYENGVVGGVAKGSKGHSIAAGARFEPGALLTAEGKVGYRVQRPKAAGYEDLAGLTVDGLIAWQATALTAVNLTLETTFDETTAAGASGAITRRGRLEAVHALRRNVSLIAGGGVRRTDYTGINLTEDVLTADLAAEWRLTPHVALRARLAYDRFKSSSPGSDYDAGIVEVGLRFRR